MTEKQPKKEYMLGEFAEICGVHKDTVRNYVEKGLLPDRRNPSNNYRVFDDTDVRRMKALTRVVTMREVEKKGAGKARPKSLKKNRGGEL
jgi:hypothetical protein